MAFAFSNRLSASVAAGVESFVGFTDSGFDTTGAGSDFVAVDVVLDSRQLLWYS